MSHGLFITFEGIDASGKSLQAARLVDHLKSMNFSVVHTRDPGGTFVSERIREILLDRKMTKMHPVTELLLYESARAQLVEEIIRPGIENKQIVICDRFTDSTIAYQGYGRSLSAQWIEEGNRLACRGLAPDLTFWLDITWEESLNRRNKANQKADRMENQELSFYDKVREGYSALANAEPGRIHKLDGSRTVKELEQIIQKTVLKEIGALTESYNEGRS